MGSKKALPLTVIIPAYNAATTIETTLKSLTEQDYPIQEIIIIDNHSTDDSLLLIGKFKENHEKIRIRIIAQKKNMGIVASYNTGIRAARYSYVVFIHSDSGLPSDTELRKLVSPIEKDPKVVATYPLILHPERVWKQYTFWEKCHFAAVVGRQLHGLSGKFDCYRKDVFIRIGGFQNESFNNETGGEDWDFHSRMRRAGKVIATNARVEHLHYLSYDYSLWDLVQKRKHVARSYGALLRLYGSGVGLKGIIAFLTKPILAIGSLIPNINSIMFPLLIIFPFFYMRKMFLTKETLFDPKILALPFVITFLIYYETFWTFERFVLTKKV